MMNFFFKTILLLIFLGVIPLSCNLKCKDTSCGCGEPEPPRKIIIKSFGVKAALVYPNFGTDVDTTLYYSSDSLCRLVYIDQTLYTLNMEKAQQPGFSFISSSFACSPLDPSYAQKINSITIISNTTLIVNSNHSIAAGDTLNDFFEARNPYNSIGTTIPDFIQNNSFDTQSQFLLRFKEKPNAPIDLAFDIKIELTDKTVHTLANQKMKLK